MSCLDNTNKVVIPTNMLLDMMNLYRFSGKDSYYNSLFKKDLDAFRAVNIQEEVFYFAKIMELGIADERIRLLAKKDIVPKNNSEKIVLIINNLEHFDLVPNEINDLANMLFNDVFKVKFRIEKVKEKNLHNKKEEFVNKKLDLELESMIRKFESMQKSASLRSYSVSIVPMAGALC